MDIPLEQLERSSRRHLIIKIDKDTDFRQQTEILLHALDQMQSGTKAEEALISAVTRKAGNLFEAAQLGIKYSNLQSQLAALRNLEEFVIEIQYFDNDGEGTSHVEAARLSAELIAKFGHDKVKFKTFLSNETSDKIRGDISDKLGLLT